MIVWLHEDSRLNHSPYRIQRHSIFQFYFEKSSVQLILNILWHVSIFCSLGYLAFDLFSYFILKILNDISADWTFSIWRIYGFWLRNVLVWLLFLFLFISVYFIFYYLDLKLLHRSFHLLIFYVSFPIPFIWLTFWLNK